MSLDPLSLTHLGSGKTVPQDQIETVPNDYPDREYSVYFETSEFTCLCPITGQPDFATLRIAYIPAARLIESKSLKLFLWSFRDKGMFHEAVVNLIRDQLVTVCKPRFLEITGEFNVRGGIGMKVVSTFDPNLPSTVGTVR